MSPLVIAVAIFVGISAMVGGLVLLVRDRPTNRIEDRLDLLTGVGNAAANGAPKQASVLNQPLDAQPSMLEQLLGKIGRIDVNLIFEQANVSLTVTRLFLISAVLAAIGAAASYFLELHLLIAPVLGGILGSLPMVWVLLRRRRRLKSFGSQLPEALEMLARALRAGQSFSAGLSMVSSEIGDPLGTEFNRMFEEQNLGIPMEESLNALAARIPNLDLKFFATAVILQRQTGGDLAEILDKIGNLVRERFKIWGQVQALTGEGRLSGVVLLALPVVLFFVVYRLNPEYIKVLFTDPMGTKMLAGGLFLQVIGALVIRKIVNIKV